MKVYTSHLKAGAPPVLVREGFSPGAAVFGFVWFLWHRAWIPAAFALALMLATRELGTPYDGAAQLALVLLAGMFGRDLVRWSLANAGYSEGPVVAAADHEVALARLMTERADLFPDLAAAVL